MIPRFSTCSKPLVESDADYAPNGYSLQKFKLYETRARFYLVGWDKSRTRWKVLKIDRSESSELSIYEDPTIYTREDCKDILNRLSEGNRSTGGLKFVTKVYGIVGFIKFLEPYYMILVTKRRPVGSICGHAIYGIAESRLLTVPHSSVRTDVAMSKAEYRYKKFFTSIDLTKDFFYSYTYRIMWSLQKNNVVGEIERMPYDDMFVWNAFLTRGFRQQIKSSLWTVALIHGFFKQEKLFTCENVEFIVTLIARRSRHFAGTRYLKRGVNDKGRVANDVETEQVVYEERWGGVGEISSVIQHRGSIPLFWSQETSILSPKPDITLHEHDPTYEATRLHFQNLDERYGHPIVVLNLVKTVEKKPRETILSREFANAVAYLNHVPKGPYIKFIQWDYHMFARSKSANVLEVLESIATEALDLIGFYYGGPGIVCHVEGNAHQRELVAPSKIDGEDYKKNLEGEKVYEDQGRISWLQRGILRSNCIDCLDRTNVAQYAFGLAALGRQMHALGLSVSDQVDSDSCLAAALMNLYQNMGDMLALQYGGSAAHNKVFSERQGKWKATTQSLEFFRSIRRHYSNAYTDGEKQDAINIFLGHFQPEKGKLALWQLDSDHHLQIRKTGDDPINYCRSSFKRCYSAGNMLDQTLSPGGVSRLNAKLMKSASNIRAGKTAGGLARGVGTISELELKHMMANGSVRKISNGMLEQETSFNLYISHSMLYRSGDVYGFGDCADIDWLSSSGNSCEDEVHERHSIISAESDNWHGSGLLGSTIEEAEGDQQNQYFEDLQADLFKKSSVQRESNLQEYGDIGSNIKKVQAGGTTIEGVLRSFADWLCSSHTLCH